MKTEKQINEEYLEKSRTRLKRALSLKEECVKEGASKEILDKADSVIAFIRADILEVVKKMES